MCGVAGYVGPAPLEGGRVERTLELMRHRGPQGSGHRRFSTPDGRTVELLHTRLEIIDLYARSNQPLAADGRWIGYNGELYNYVELRRDLEGRGEPFATESDTEVLLRLVGRDGLDALDRCEGMWAFALYDEGSGALHLSRDRFGEKPLYILRDGAGGLYFGSEAKFVAELAGRRLRPDHEHLHRYLVNGYKSLYKQPATFFEDLEELPPGHVLSVGEGGGESLAPYWRPEVGTPDEDMAYEDAVAGARERLIRSVELRLRADVPLAFCMSGGVDSQSLISVAKRVFDYDVHGFTIVNSDERYEEQDMVDYAVAELGVRHTAIPVDTRDFLPRLRTLVRHHDAPVYTITYFAHWMLMQSIAEHGYRISISGTAADELFTGYYDHHLAYLREVHGEPELHAASLAAWREHVAPVVRNPHLKDPDLFVKDPGFRDHIYLDADEFASHLHVPFNEPFEEARFDGAGLLRTRMLNELFHEAVPVILHEDDLNAMYFSIENRSPFLDRDLFEFSLRIPERHLVQDGRAKAVLRDAMDGIVPPRITENRRKVGFNAPVLDYLDVGDPEVRGWLLGDGEIWEHVRRDAIEGILDLDFLPNSKSKFLFNLVNAKLFLEEFGS
ncbi:MAG: asparagine synthase (glutamine-hydrolyzing) [Thermoleophilaceae bacterium]